MSVRAAGVPTGRRHHSHQTSRPKDSASSTKPIASAPYVIAADPTPEAAKASEIPAVAVTTLRQWRGGSWARIQGSTQPATANT